ncbi:MAG: hypothetical protein JWL92_150, partial [Candidatus Nomurabacteria bacterium]|nr:hypothetical protein [Candidatus Nomurabacteria bacterium]
MSQSTIVCSIESRNGFVQHNLAARSSISVNYHDLTLARVQKNQPYQSYYAYAIVQLSQFELIHDQLPLAVPCYDLFPVTDLTVVPSYEEPSGTTGSLELTGGEYKTRERIHRSLADLRLLAIPTSSSRVA